jgi:uncharacterized membrane protein
MRRQVAGAGAEGRGPMRPLRLAAVILPVHGSAVRAVGAANSMFWRKSMSDLIVVGFDDEATAFELRAALVKLQREYLIEMEDAVVVTKSVDGKVALHQAVNLTAVGAAGGTFWGLLVGMLFLNPLLGAAVGAGSGALSGKLSDIGIEDKFMKEIGATLTNGGAAVCVLVRKMTGDKVLAGLSEFQSKGRVMQTSLSTEQEARLKALMDAPAAPTA